MAKDKTDADAKPDLVIPALPPATASEVERSTPIPMWVESKKDGAALIDRHELEAFRKRGFEAVTAERVKELEADAAEGVEKAEAAAQKRRDREALERAKAQR